ncbi:MAG: peptidylprolyl isomerase [Phycisphaerales bacterium JB065]
MKTLKTPPSSVQAERAFACDLAQFEQLERRVLLAGDLTFIEWFEADDRGNVVLQMSQALDGNTVNGTTVQILLAGPDGLLGTADDEVADVVVSYDALNNQITIDGDFDQSTRYAIRIDGDQIRDAKGDFIDAEFMGMGNETGDGVAGGEFLVFTRPPENDLVARIFTEFGNIDILLFRDTTPITVANFLNYAQSGRYDETFFHRLVEDFVLQAGGFYADEDFSEVETDAPIMNEFNLSNLFGTIAMAKVSGDPNSATSQFFFNLADNSENLDNQNGGFTVFGEITPESFDVLAALAGLTTVDASSQNGAFGDVPVIDPDAVDGDLTPDDVIVLTRVSIIQDVSSQPFQQLGADNTEVFTSNYAGNNSRVYIYDLDGVNTGNIADFVSVVFSPHSNAVQSIVIHSGFEGRIGISVAGANSVGVIRDMRATEQGQIAFIASEVIVGSIYLRHSVAGMDLAGFTLGGGFQIDEDVARDGNDIDNLLGVYVQNGYVGSLTILGDVEADIVLEGGTQLIRILGQTIDSTIRIGNAGYDALPNPPAVTNVVLGNADNTGISSAVPLGLVRATNWTNSSDQIAEILAPTLRNLTITGNPAQGLAGDFEANLTLTGDADAQFSLLSAFVRGSVFGSTWDVTGDVNLLRFVTAFSASTANFAGDVRNLIAGVVSGATIDVGGQMNLVRSFEWEASFFTSASAVRAFQVLGHAGLNLAGNFSGDVVINQDQDDLPVFNVRVNGNATNGAIAIGSTLYTAVIVGNTDNFELVGPGDAYNILIYGDSVETNVEWGSIINVLRVGNYTDGEIGTNSVNRFIAYGDVSGDFDIRQSNLFVVYGDADFDLFSNSIADMRIYGDLLNSEWNFEGTGSSGTQSLGSLLITGSLQDTIITADRNIGSITAKGMFNSELYVGAPEGQFGLPDSPDDMDLNATIGSIRITGIGGNQDSMANSFIVAGRIDSAYVFRPTTSNFGTPFGIAAGSIGQVTTVFPGFTVSRSNPNAVLPQGDYEVRIGFVPA